MNHSYQYTNGGIRGEETTQGQGEEPGVFGNRATPYQLRVAFPSLTQTHGYQHPIDVDNKKERVTPATQTSFLVVDERMHLISNATQGQINGVIPFLPPYAACEVD